MAQVQPQSQNPNGSGAGGAQFGTTSLYVGDVDANVTDSQLFEAFSQMGQVVSVRVCRDLATRRSLGYAYVNFTSPQDAARAIQELNYIPLNGRPVRVMYSRRDPSVRRSGAGNIFIKNLDKSIDHKALHDTFSAFGSIISCKVAVDSSGQSKGYGFVQYETEESAQKAMAQLNGMLLNDKQVYVGPFLRRQERDSTANVTKFTNVYVKNLAESTTDDDLKNTFGEFGNITSAVVMKDGDGKSKGFGFVNFDNADDAAKAVEALNGKTFDDKEWYVGRAQKKNERETELKVRYEQSLREAADKFQSCNLYVKNLDDSVSDEKLKELFTSYGTVTSCKVMRDPNGISRGSGFVAFSTPEEATKAMSEMSGKMIENKPLYVAVAQRKEDRKARLQAQFSQMRPGAMPPSVAPRLQMYPPGGPGIGQQMFYGQAPPPMIPPQTGFGYQQQMVPGMRPGGGPMHNFFMPMVQQRPGGRRPGGIQQSHHHQQQQVPMMMQQQQQHQMHPRGRTFRYSQGRGSGGPPDVPGMLPNEIPITMPLRDPVLSQHVPIGALATSLANASPEHQRTMLGENLYPLVEQLEAESAAKVTGMLLEMDQTEVLHLLESPEALKAKVAEAMDVLRSVAAGGAAEQLASLNLNDNLVS
ncbi:Polyadenylate-binding protein 2 [Raphanus sativus]|uniref:Polyadenylate-binding protein n=2 Tax=Brassiceae TaxID=981071 RepID=A0A6J0JUA7_RAPSA|nr:polyadenylate-binding protein 2 [Raphanus sativus]KAJ4889268.1 Polyadenylate-binding protein 2 [Raphanus sativus]